MSIYYYFRLLAEGNLELSHEFLSLGVIEHLLFALGNHEHTDAQVQASLALEVQNMSTYTDGHILYTNTVHIHLKTAVLSAQHFVRSFPAAEERVRSVMGHALFTDFMVRFLTSSSSHKAIRQNYILY